MNANEATLDASDVENAKLWGEWSVQLVFNWSDPFWGPLTVFTDIGVFVFGLGGPRVVITWPVRV